MNFLSIIVASLFAAFAWGQSSVFILTDFEGIDQDDAGEFDNPADPVIAASPSQVVHVVNQEIRVWDREDLPKVEATADFVDFFGTETQGDPRVLYDAGEERFVVSAMSTESTTYPRTLELVVVGACNPQNPRETLQRRRPKSPM
jgi:hypothetical protein